jgi:hypothetical protein
MPQKSPFTLNSIQDELNLQALIHFSKNYEAIEHLGQDSMVNAILKSNIQAVMESEIAMPIRLANNEIYEMVIKNNRGIVAKEGRANRYLVVLRIDMENTLAAIGDDLDPGMVLFEMLKFSKR